MRQWNSSEAQQRFQRAISPVPGVTCIQLLTAPMPDELYNPVDGNWIWREILAKKGQFVSYYLGKVLDKILQKPKRSLSVGG